MASPDLRLQDGPHVFVDSLDAPALDADDRHHLAKALRLRDGDPLTLSDGAGRWRTAIFTRAVEATGPIHSVPKPEPEITLGIALAKSGKPEFTVQKATELGVDRIVLFPTEHSVVRWDEAKRGKNQVRLRRVAREAAMQSRQVRIPKVEIAASLAEAIAGERVARTDFVATTTIADHTFLLIGPEGGWSEAERTLVPAAVELGPTVLRAETAAVVAAAALAAGRTTARR